MKCPKCGKELYKGSNGALCSGCNHFFKLNELPKRYKFVVIGKNIEFGNTFMERLCMKLEEIGHDIIKVDRKEMFSFIRPFEFRDFEENKMAISLRPIEYKYNPDLIIIEQCYYRFKNDIKTPILYHHREYTHFPDVEDPDIITFAYPRREKQFEYYYPYSYRRKIEKKHNLFVGVDMDMFNPNKNKIIDGKVDIGWAIDYWQFQESNGPFAYDVIEEQKRFAKYCEKKGITRRINPPIDKDQYIEIMERSRSVVIDGGSLGWLTRRIFEAMASKTVPIIRVYNEKQKKFYKGYKLINGENCILFSENFLLGLPNLKEINLNDYNLEEIAENGYKWVKQHTYEKRAKKLLKIYEEYIND